MYNIDHGLDNLNDSQFPLVLQINIVNRGPTEMRTFSSLVEFLPPTNAEKNNVVPFSS